jgi:hypothetical protein
MDLDASTIPQFATHAEFMAALQDPNLPSPYEQLHAPLPGDSSLSVVGMSNPPQIESGSTGDTGTSGSGAFVVGTRGPRAGYGSI